MRTINVIAYIFSVGFLVAAGSILYIQLSDPTKIDPNNLLGRERHHFLGGKSGVIIINDKEVVVLDSENNVVIREKDLTGLTYKIVAEMGEQMRQRDSIEQNTRIKSSLRPPSKIKKQGARPIHVFKDSIYWESSPYYKVGPVVPFTDTHMKKSALKSAHERIETGSESVVVGTPYLTKAEGYMAGPELRITEVTADAAPGLIMGKDNSTPESACDSIPKGAKNTEIGESYLTVTEGYEVPYPPTLGYAPVPKYKVGDTFERNNGETVQISCTESYDSFGRVYLRSCVASWDKTVKDWVYNTLTVSNSGDFIYGAMSEKELDKLKRLEGVHIIGTGERNK